MNLIDPEVVIKGANRIVEIYGCWPSFHDFEIVKILFERNLVEDRWGPHITVYIHMCEVCGKSAKGNNFKYHKHNVVGILFRNILDYSEQGFNQQNVINDIQITLTHDESNNDIYQVIFPSLYGVALALSCRQIEIASIESGIPAFSIHVEEA